jgi:hypothetical protein
MIDENIIERFKNQIARKEYEIKRLKAQLSHSQFQIDVIIELLEKLIKKAENKTHSDEL